MPLTLIFRSIELFEFGTTRSNFIRLDYKLETVSAKDHVSFRYVGRHLIIIIITIILVPNKFKPLNSKLPSFVFYIVILSRSFK